MVSHFGAIFQTVMSFNRDEDEETNRNFIQSSLTQSTVKRDKAMAIRFQNWLRRVKGVVSLIFHYFRVTAYNKLNWNILPLCVVGWRLSFVESERSGSAFGVVAVVSSKAQQQQRVRAGHVEQLPPIYWKVKPYFIYFVLLLSFV